MHRLSSHSRVVAGMICAVAHQYLTLPAHCEEAAASQPLARRSFRTRIAAALPAGPTASAALGELLRSALQSCSGGASIPAAAVCVDQEELAFYSSSQYSYHSGAPPHAVAFPRSTAEVSALVRVCSEHRVNVIARAGGTSLEGQVVPAAAGAGWSGEGGEGEGEEEGAGRATVVIDMRHMNKVLRVSSEDLDATVQAGVGWMDLAGALQPHGMTFPVDPGPGAMIGGMCGTGCSGTQAVRHGAMKNNVLSLTAVASDGTIFRTGGRARKSVAGLDLTSLLIGSEGTLGVVTEAVLRLAPLPAASVVIVTPFATVRAACSAVALAARAGLPLAAAELLDGRMAGVVRAQGGGQPELLPAGAVPHVLWRLSGGAGAVEEAAAALQAVAVGAGALAWQRSLSPEQAAELWEARKAALFSVQAAHAECSVLTTDVCVPVSRLPELLENFEAHYAALAGGEGGGSQGLLPAAYAVAHAGDGNAHHFLAFQAGTAQESQAKQLADWLAGEAIKLEGTCTGEHGVGTGKRKYLVKELGEGNALVAAAIKHALDPSGVLNPGKKLAICR